ncbi:hypothetical protein BpHYR1_010656 [Brachionus plicatilis]|uniref:Uncharacterized protein n=1 Tax=Brachionus plicatilis TaxID=10195 RepID=A0A3M7SLQ2_BRAPC|nr:hypothetical protein BpHYR1_010656 [Brachionus plicatilis]
MDEWLSKEDLLLEIVLVLVVDEMDSFEVVAVGTEVVDELAFGVQFSGLKTRPDTRPIKRITHRPDTIPTIRTGKETFRPFLLEIFILF